MFASFNPESLAKALEILLVGWGGVFLVLGIVYAASLALTRLFPAARKDR